MNKLPHSQITGQESTSLAKPIEVIQADGGGSYHVTVDDAWELVRGKSAKWTGRKEITLTPDRWCKVTWEPLQSGYAGPLVLQIVTAET